MVTKPRGTKDNYGINYANYQEMVALIINRFRKYNFHAFSTPIFESEALFTTSVGETSDIVNKEMYRFNDRKNRSLVLRPEGTAPIVRALIENKLYLPPLLPLKIYYYGPMFRYERPQVGRSRQFEQLGIEVFGRESLYQDLEIMRLIKDLTDTFNLSHEVILDINYLISGEKREHYIAELKKNLTGIEDLCDLCQIRLQKNPLRVLDCKEDCHKFKDLPKMTAYLNPTETGYWNKFQKGLEEIGLRWAINPRLVRGLDYYTGLIFELKTTHPVLKSQSTFLAGGRYNHLVENLGGPALEAIGFAIGAERLFELVQISNKKIFSEPVVDFYLWAPENSDWRAVDQLMSGLRNENFTVATDFTSKDLKRAYRKAEQLRAKNILLVNGTETPTTIEWKSNRKHHGTYQILEFLTKLTAKGNK